jgi:hypothetical protein
MVASSGELVEGDASKGEQDSHAGECQRDAELHQAAMPGFAGSRAIVDSPQRLPLGTANRAPAFKRSAPGPVVAVGAEVANDRRLGAASGA